MNIVKIIDIDNQGRGIGRLNNKVIFIPNTLIDEEVEVEITLEKKDYLEGKVINYIKKSNKRIKEKCNKDCGGCNLLHLSYNDQLIIKQTIITDIINKFLKEKIKINEIIKSDIEYNYRNKITLHVINGILGLYKPKTNEIVEIDECLLVDNKINEIIKKLKQYDLSNNKEIVIKSTSLNTMLVIDHFIKDIEKINVDTIICNNKVIKGTGYIEEIINNYRYLISKDSFFQINKKQTEKLYNLVLKYAQLEGKEQVLDLYCGTGTIGLYIAKNAQKVIGVELNKEAIEMANKNKELNNINNIEFICGDAKEVIKKINSTIDLIIVDPPRSGLYKGMIEDINEFKSKKIIYVSCNPITLARDLNILKEKYEIIEIQPVDMFPNTYHVETVSVLCRKTIEK